MNLDAAKAIEGLIKEERNKRIDECIERLQQAKERPLRTYRYPLTTEAIPVETLLSDVELYMKRLGEIPELIKKDEHIKALEVALGAYIDPEDMA